MKIPEQVAYDFKQAVLIDYPNETCGIMVDNSFVHCKNVHNEPTKHFAIDPIALIDYEDKIQAIFHSHPYDLRDRSEMTRQIAVETPSLNDCHEWSKGNLPWVIASCDGQGVSNLVVMDENDPAPLEGREFIWGYQDCYSLIRDYYRTKLNITLPHIHREWGFWAKPDAEDVFVESYKKVGFKLVPKEELDVNDLCLFKIQSKIINHIGVVVGSNELLQQTAGQTLSRKSRLDLYKKDIMMCLRYSSPINT